MDVTLLFQTSHFPAASSPTAPRLVPLYKQCGDPECHPWQHPRGRAEDPRVLGKLWNKSGEGGTALKLPAKPCKPPMSRGELGIALKSVKRRKRKACAYLYSFFLRFYFFLDRVPGREGEREGEKHQCAGASRTAPTGDLARHPGMCPDRTVVLRHD